MYEHLDAPIEVRIREEHRGKASSVYSILIYDEQGDIDRKLWGFSDGPVMTGRRYTTSRKFIGSMRFLSEDFTETSQHWYTWQEEKEGYR